MDFNAFASEVMGLFEQREAKLLSWGFYDVCFEPAEAEIELTAADAEMLQCSSCRMVTSKGVYVCPILIDVPDARMGETLTETLRTFPLRYGACHTCWVEGVSCRT